MWRRLLLAVLLALLGTGLPSIGHAASSLDELKHVRAIFVTVDDNVRNGCLPNPRSLKTEAELVLRTAKISIVDKMPDKMENSGVFELAIKVLGGLITTSGNICMIASDFQLWSIVTAQSDGRAVFIEAFTSNNIMSRFKYATQTGVREAVNETVSDLANTILKKRRQ